jgi:hypothetical protein
MKTQNTVATLALGVAMSVLIQVQTAQADSTNNLATLAGTGGTLTVGDKTFSGFNYVADDLTSFNAANIQVIASQVGNSYFLTWNGNISILSGGPATGDLELNYTVTASDGLIYAIDQGYTGTVDAPAGGFLTVTENAYVPGNTVAVASSDLNQMLTGTSFTAPGAMLYPAQPTLNITKDIGFADTGGYITISQVEQSFEQIAVPEPVTTSCLFLGLGVLALTRRFGQN